MADPSAEHLDAVARLSPAERRHNIESRLLARLTMYGGERIVDGHRMQSLIRDLADETERLAREGFLAVGEADGSGATPKKGLDHG